MKKCLFIYLIGLLFSNHVMGQSEKLPGIIKDSKADSIICGNESDLKDNMAQMGFMIRNLRELVNDFVQGADSYHLEAVIMVDIQVLRTHLIAVLPKTPEKIIKIEPQKVQQNKLVFQEYILKMVQLTIEVERTLLDRPQSLAEEKEQRIKVGGLILQIDETVGKAHSLFRF
jgi:hypothetical protein